MTIEIKLRENVRVSEFPVSQARGATVAGDARTLLQSRLAGCIRLTDDERNQIQPSVVFILFSTAPPAGSTLCHLILVFFSFFLTSVLTYCSIRMQSKQEAIIEMKFGREQIEIELSRQDHRTDTIELVLEPIYFIHLITKNTEHLIIVKKTT